MAEDQPRLGDAREQLLLVVRRPGHERADVARPARRGRSALVGGPRRAARRAPRPRPLRAPRGRRRSRRAGAGCRARSSGAAVQRSPLPRIHARARAAQARDRRLRLRAEERVVAAEDPALGARAARVGQHRLERGQVPVDVVEEGDHRRVYSIGTVTPAADEPLVVAGRPHAALRDAGRRAGRCSTLARDPAVTRFFSWGPYTSLEQPQAYIAGLPGEARARRAARLPDRPPRGRADRRHRPVRARRAATAARPSAPGSGTAGGGAAPTRSRRR